MTDKNNFIASKNVFIKPSPTMAVTKLAAELKAQGRKCSRIRCRGARL